MAGNQKNVRCVWLRSIGFPAGIVLGMAGMLLSPQGAVAAETKVQGPSRVAVPAEDALHRAEAAARQLYERDIADAQDDLAKRILAKKLLQAALPIKDNPTDRFALLRMARETSKEAADIATAFTSIDEMAKGFEVNPLEMKAVIIAAVAEKATSAAQRRFVVDHCISLIGAALTADEYTVAQAMLQTAQTLSRKDRELTHRLSGWPEKIESGATAFAGVKSAMSRLQEKPEDPEANAIVGKHSCFSRGDFSRGLPMLKKSGDLILKGLAEQDLANPSGPAQQLSLADAWWQLAETSEAAGRSNIRARAHFWYSKAIPNLTGLGRIRAQQRIEQFELTRFDLDTAITSGLDWLARQQQTDGRWTFACDPDPGKWTSSVAATSLAILPFLNAGHTHLQGDYKLVVRRGLVYLTNQMQVSPNGGDLRDTDSSGMTAHALGSLALCEAYARSKDKRLQTASQLTLSFLAYAQNPKDGGFYATPRGTGYTVFLGWPLMAFLAASECGLAVPRQTAWGIDGFLDRVQADGGGGYRLSATTSADSTPLTTAIGLLARAQLTGHGRSPAVKDGIRRLAALPVSADVHFQFLAASLISHADRDVWEKWKPGVQNALLKLQDKEGLTKGSWFNGVTPSSPLARSEIGRVGTTSLCLVTLQVTKR